MMKSMTSDLWYVGRVLANEPERERDEEKERWSKMGAKEKKKDA